MLFKFFLMLCTNYAMCIESYRTQDDHVCALRTHVCMCACMHVCMCVFTSTAISLAASPHVFCVPACVCMHACVCVCKRACVYVCVYLDCYFLGCLLLMSSLSLVLQHKTTYITFNYVTFQSVIILLTVNVREPTVA